MSRTGRALLATLALTFAVAAPAGAQSKSKYFDVGKLPAPTTTGGELASLTESFSTDYAQRVTGSAIEIAAGNYIAEQTKAMGYETTVQALPATAGLPGSPLKAIVATRKGRTKPDESILFIGHYDQVPQTINAAYDNGSGTAMLLGLAKAMAKVDTHRTITFVFYNGEEEGALASERHAQIYADEKRAVRAVLGFDMVGIAWPVAAPSDISCLCLWRGSDDDALDALLSHVAFKVLGFPDADQLVEVKGLNQRNSDEASWDARDYTTLRWSGLEGASDYPEYHLPGDTMATIDEFSGGRVFFEQGMRNTLTSAYYTVLALDNEMPTVQAKSIGDGPVSFDTAGSADADGALGKITWDFGDGTSGEGPAPTHAYAKPGVYQVKVSVQDDLWPQVAATSSFPVSVAKGASTTSPPGTTAKKLKCRKGFTLKKRKCVRLKKCRKGFVRKGKSTRCVRRTRR